MSKIEAKLKNTWGFVQTLELLFVCNIESKNISCLSRVSEIDHIETSDEMLFLNLDLLFTV